MDIDAAQAALESIIRLEKAGRMNEVLNVLKNPVKTIPIPSTAAVRRFNRAVERVDELSGYRFDRCDAWQLVKWLLAKDYLNDAVELQSAARAAQCWEETE